MAVIRRHSALGVPRPLGQLRECHKRELLALVACLESTVE
jgi:hypothetical protein